ADATEALLGLLAEQRGIDLRDWRRDAVIRRLVRTAPVENWLARATLDPTTLDEVLRAVIVPVTSFFRDAEVFRALEVEVIPALVRAVRGRPIRAWAAGVATGEEAWSLAALLVAADVPFEIIATDLDESALKVARAARYAP